MLKSKLFWGLSFLFAAFAISIIWSAVSLYKYNEDKIINHALKAQKETFKYISNKDGINDKQKLLKELKEHGWEFVCLGVDCKAPDGFSYVLEIEENDKEIYIHKNLYGNIFALMDANGEKLGIMLNFGDNIRHIQALLQLFVLLTLMLGVYILAIFGLRQNIKIKNMFAAQEEMLNTVSHEIKTPLSKARLALEFIPDSDKKEIIKKALRYIDGLSGDILKSRSLDAKQKAKIQASEIVHLAKEALFDDERIAIKLVKDFELYANQEIIVVAIKNLAQNALIHSSDGKCIIIVEGNKIKVCSLGKQLNESLEVLCGEFVKKDNSKGFGLGLYIVNQSAKNSGLKLGLEYENGFNVFWI
ncbi:MAG: hypothetical protein RL154_271 [Pseudomonadota bacterium]|jgi:signal transduction histidine kinase